MTVVSEVFPPIAARPLPALNVKGIPEVFFAPDNFGWEGKRV
jgi:hypothetical protein